MEKFVDVVMHRWAEYPEMHIYHFAPYEPAALKRLMSKHATREDEIDQLLRGGRFVDLHAIVRQGIRASVESYSIKKLEVFYGFDRQMDLDEATAALLEVERLTELGWVHQISAKHRYVVETYNKDDCLSTLALRNWLEMLREELVSQAGELPRPQSKPGEGSEVVQQRNNHVQELFNRLAAGIAEEPSAPREQSRWLLAQMLDYFRREEKCHWWEFFRLHDLEDDELLHERHGIAGLRFLGVRTRRRKRSQPDTSVSV